MTHLRINLETILNLGAGSLFKSSVHYFEMSQNDAKMLQKCLSSKVGTFKTHTRDESLKTIGTEINYFYLSIFLNVQLLELKNKAAKFKQLEYSAQPY